MNICYVAPDIPVPHTGDFIGGSTHTLEVAKGLAGFGNTVYIISRRMSGQKFFEKISDRVYTYRIYRGIIIPVKGGVTGKADLRPKLKIFENIYFNTIYRLFVMVVSMMVLRKHNIEVILERNSAKGAGVFSGMILGIPALVEVIDPEYSRCALRLCRKIFAYTEKILPEDVLSKTEIIHAGVDAELFRPVDSRKVREAHGIKGNIVVYVGSMSAWHGAEHLIGVAERMKDMDVTFLMVGKDVAALKELAKRKGVPGKFVFTGFVDYKDVPAYIAAADVAVAPYDPAGFKGMEKHGFYFSPIKIFEYMACGKPVITSNVEIVRDLIKENECGIVAEPGDIEELADKIKFILNNPELREKLGKNGRKAVLEKYSWNHVVERFQRGLAGVL